MRVAVYARSLLGRFRRRRRHTGPEMRQDPRTDHLCSLRNLLRTRAMVNLWPLIAIGTSYDLLVAASESGRAGEELLIRAKQAGGAPKPATLRFAVGGQALILAIDALATPTDMLEIADRVRCIMQEQRAAA